MLVTGTIALPAFMLRSEKQTEWHKGRLRLEPLLCFPFLALVISVMLPQHRTAAKEVAGLHLGLIADSSLAHPSTFHQDCCLLVATAQIATSKVIAKPHKRRQQFVVFR